MSSIQFNTISTDLQGLALRAYGRYDSLGYSIKVEATELGFPFTPALVCKRNQTTILIEVGKDELANRVSQWVAFCKSSGKDMRLCIVVSNTFVVKPGLEKDLRERGVGVLRADNGGFMEVLPAKDLAINVQLPDPSSFSAKAKKCLGTAYEDFGKGDWRNGFEEACQTLEDIARLNLINGIKKTRIVFIGKKGPVNFSLKQIRKGTMGQLRSWYSMIQSPRQIESVLGRALALVVKDRNRVTHAKHKAATEHRLRARVGRHMWTIVEAVKIATT